MVLRESLVLVGIGVTLGLPLVFAASRFPKAMLFGLAPSDSVSAVSATLVLMMFAPVAGYLPTLRGGPDRTSDGNSYE